MSRRGAPAAAPILRKAFTVARLAFAGFLISPAFAQTPSTLAERTAYAQTGRYAEVEELCRTFAVRWPDLARCVEFGRTPQDRPMLSLVASRTGALEPHRARAEHVPVVLVQAGIHAGEIEGKDAGFEALRHLLEHGGAADPLRRLVLVFVPVFNVDGHERFGRWNRPNQNGPAEMGWRTTAQNLNLNRDYVKADAPEMRAMLQLLDRWDPMLYVDLHATDGAQFQHDVAVLVEPRLWGDPTLQPLGRELQTAVLARLASQGSLPLTVYPALREQDNPESGVADYTYSPRYSAGYWAARNRFGMLVEMHSWKDYATRVRVTRNVVLDSLAQAAANAGRWQEAMAAADRRAATLGGSAVPLAMAFTDRSRPFDFLGYEYRREHSDISGRDRIIYDPTKPQVWHLRAYEEVRPSITVTAPAGGYVVPLEHAKLVAGLLEAHGIASRVIRRRLSDLPLETFRASRVEASPRTFEGRTMISVAGEWRWERTEVLPGSVFVPIAQAKALLVLSMLEPLAPDSLVAWGFFNACFEEKETMEPYVAEQVAREMLAADPALAAEFRARLQSDAAFVADPAARLEFFSRRHPSWDARRDVYPVLRAAASPE